MANPIVGLWERLYFYFLAPGRRAFMLNLGLRSVIVILVGLLILAFRKSRSQTQYEFKIVTMNDGLNKWELVTNTTLTFTHGTQEVKPDALYTIRPSIIQKIRWVIMNISGGFIIVFKSGSNEAIKYEKPTRTAETLLTIQESRALGQALKDEFRQALGGRTIFIVIFVVVIGVLVYYFYIGRIGG